LSAVPGGGGNDRISALIAEYADVIGLKDWRVWDANQIMSFLDVHHDVATSFAALITPNALIATLRETVMRSAAPAAIQIGEGLPSSEAAFRHAFEAAGGSTRLGHPTGPAHEFGPGFVQYLRSLDGVHDSVICSLPNQPAVVVAGSVWAEISTLGDPNHGSGVDGAGFPSAAAGEDRYIGPDLPLIELVGGQWGPGSLVSGESGRRVWRPQIRFDPLASRDRTIWTGIKADLRVRIAVRIPWPTWALRIDSAGRRRVEAALAAPDATEVVQVLGRPRQINAGQPRWTKTSDADGRNDTWGVSYECTLDGPDGRPAIVGRALFQLPTMPTESSALTLVDVRVDFDALRPSAPGTADAAPPEQLRISVTELVSVFTCAWQVAIAVLPLAVAVDPTALAPAGAPRLELYVFNERPDTMGGDRTLRTEQMLDLTPFGATTKTNLYDLTIGVTAPLDLTGSEIEATVKAAMVRMAEDVGFTDADLATL